LLTKHSKLRKRIEAPVISIYLDDAAVLQEFIDQLEPNVGVPINALSNLPDTRIAGIWMPSNTHILLPDMVFLPDIEYDFRVTIIRGDEDASSFHKWMTDNPKIKISKAAIRSLVRTNWRSYQPTLFYVKDARTLTMVSMLVGGMIKRVEKILHE
jgi:hypothetical protein